MPAKYFRGEEDPIPYAHIVTSTTHKTLRGPRGGFVLCTAPFADSVNKGCPLVLGGPLPHVMAAKAVAFKENLEPSFKTYAARVVENARTLAEAFQQRGLSIVTGGTDNHLLLIDLSNTALTGRIAESALNEAGVTANRNMVPFDPNGAWYTSGMRLGTPALTTLGMGKEEMVEVADIVTNIIRHTKPQIIAKTGLPSKAKGETDPKAQEEAKGRIAELLSRYPLYPELIV